MCIDLSSLQIRRDVCLAPMTTFKIGGVAKYFAEAQNSDMIIKYINSGLNYAIIGGGSNLLVSDSGFDGLVIAVKSKDIEISDVVTVDAGVSLPYLSKLYSMNHMTGLEWACSIPGTIGGAVVMNAGAHSSAISDSVIRVQALIDGKKQWLNKNQCGFDYRTSVFLKGGIVLKAELSYTYGDAAEIDERVAKFKQFRSSTQPTGFSAGSVFKSADKSAGFYIDNAGLKGFSVGGAVVSDKHANFIINRGNATAKDVRELILIIKEKVLGKFGVRLIEEIKYLGDF